MAEAFGEHWRDFDAEAQLLADLLPAGRLTVLVGPSGVGKSTLLTDGMLPLLRRRATTPADAPAAQDGARAGPLLLFADAWHEAALDALWRQLAGTPAADRGRFDLAQAMAPAQLAALSRRHGGAQLLFIFDHFEQLLVGAAQQPELQRFVDALAVAMRAHGVDAQFLVAIDERAWPLMQALCARMPEVQTQAFRLQARPDRQGLRGLDGTPPPPPQGGRPRAGPSDAEFAATLDSTLSETVTTVRRAQPPDDFSASLDAMLSRVAHSVRPGDVDVPTLDVAVPPPRAPAVGDRPAAATAPPVPSGAQTAREAEAERAREMATLIARAAQAAQEGAAREAEAAREAAAQRLAEQLAAAQAAAGQELQARQAAEAAAAQALAEQHREAERRAEAERQAEAARAAEAERRAEADRLTQALAAAEAAAARELQARQAAEAESARRIAEAAEAARAEIARAEAERAEAAQRAEAARQAETTRLAQALAAAEAAAARELQARQAAEAESARRAAEAAQAADAARAEAERAEAARRAEAEREAEAQRLAQALAAAEAARAAQLREAAEEEAAQRAAQAAAAERRIAADAAEAAETAEAARQTVTTEPPAPPAAAAPSPREPLDLVLPEADAPAEPAAPPARRRPLLWVAALLAGAAAVLLWWPGGPASPPPAAPPPPAPTAAAPPVAGPPFELLAAGGDPRQSRLVGELAAALSTDGRPLPIVEVPGDGDALAGLQTPGRLAIVRLDTLQAARDRAPASLQVLSPLFAEPVLFVVRADSPLTNIDALRGRRIGIDAAAGDEPTVRALLQHLFGTGIAEPARFADDQALAELVAFQSIDAIAVVAAQPAAWWAALDPATAQRLRLLPLARGEPAAGARPVAFGTSQVRLGPDGASGAPTTTPAAMSLLVSSGGADTERLVAMAQALCQQLPQLRAQGDARWRQLQPATAMDIGWPVVAPVQTALADCAAR